MKITIARIRSNVTYTGPLETVLDSFFENYVKWQRSRTDLQYDVYNVSFTNQRPVRNPEAIKNADVIVIPSDSEFRYYGNLQMNPKDLIKSESYVDKILVLNSAKGGVATSWMLRNMKLNNKSPKALILNSTNPIMVQAVAFADITLIHNFDTDITSYFKTGDILNINPFKACVYKI